jgi:hypothetical protein
VKRAAALAAALLLLACSRAEEPVRRAAVHIAIGVPDTLDALKTFVDDDGSFSPGAGSYGVSFSVDDLQQTQIARGLSGGGALVPWVRWRSGEIEVLEELCSVRPDGAIVAAARVTLTNRGAAPREVVLRARVRESGPAGWPFRRITFDDGALLVDGHTAVVADRAATHDRDSLRLSFSLAPGASRQARFVCPVLAGRRAWRHRWDGKSEEVQLDLATPGDDGPPQPDLGIAAYRAMSVDALFAEALRTARGAASIEVPDVRWSEAFRAVPAHIALTMNDGTPDVAVVNYNTFTRDGVYMTAVLQQSGAHALAARAVESFLRTPFSGRVQPEADNPGEVLWIAGEQWKVVRDHNWLARIYPQAMRLAALIETLRTTPDPHFVGGKRLIPGACDGLHPEFTEAFDIAGLRAAAELARDSGDAAAAAHWQSLAAELLRRYDDRFAGNLGREYGSYCVLWPARLYPLERGKAHERFIGTPPQDANGWRYFPLATAHQGLLAGHRAAAHETLARHFALDSMRGWYALDEGGESGPGIWPKLRTTWNPRVAMPHGWALAELWLLLRDSVVFEDEDRLVLFAGVPPQWFASPMRVEHLGTHYGPLTLRWTPDENGATLELSGAAPPGGFVLRMPERDVRIAAHAGPITYRWLMSRTR